MTDDLLPLPLTPRTVHLCIDMQRIFSPDGPWATPWMERVLPVVLAISHRFPERTVFTRFITPQRDAIHNAAACERHAGNMVPLL
jgi:nicotinamidase-related amidase